MRISREKFIFLRKLKLKKKQAKINYFYNKTQILSGPYDYVLI